MNRKNKIIAAILAATIACGGVSLATGCADTNDVTTAESFSLSDVEGVLFGNKKYFVETMTDENGNIKLVNSNGISKIAEALKTINQCYKINFGNGNINAELVNAKINYNGTEGYKVQMMVDNLILPDAMLNRSSQIYHIHSYFDYNSYDLVFRTLPIESAEIYKVRIFYAKAIKTDPMGTFKEGDYLASVTVRDIENNLVYFEQYGLGSDNPKIDEIRCGEFEINVAERDLKIPISIGALKEKK